MAALTTAEIASLRTSTEEHFAGTAVIKRNPAESGGTVAAATAVGTVLAVYRVVSPDSPLAQAPAGLGGGRVTHIGGLKYTASLLEGDLVEYTEGTVTTTFRNLRTTNDSLQVISYAEEVRI